MKSKLDELVEKYEAKVVEKYFRSTDLPFNSVIFYAGLIDMYIENEVNPLQEAYIETEEKINDLEESKKYLQDALRLEKYLYSQSRKILNECLQVMFKDGETYTPLQVSAYKKAKDFLNEH